MTEADRTAAYWRNRYDVLEQERDALMEAVEKITRYGFFKDYNWGEGLCHCEMDIEVDGGWVRYEDLHTLLATTDSEETK